MKQGTDKDFRPDYNLISVNKDLIFDTLLSDVSEYVRFLTENINKITAERSVYFLNETANQYVYTKVFQSLHEKLPQKFFICKTIEEVIEKIGEDIPVSMIKEVAANLYNNPKYIV